MAAAFVLGEIGASGHRGTGFFLVFCAAAAGYLGCRYAGWYLERMAGRAGAGHRRGRAIAELALLSVCFLLGGVRWRQEEQKLAYADLAASGTRLEIWGRVDWVKETAYGEQLMVSRTQLRGGGVSGLRLLVRREDDAGRALSPGDWILAEGVLEEFETAGNPGEFDSREYYRSLGCHYAFTMERLLTVREEALPLHRTLAGVRSRLSESLRQACDAKTCGVYLAMLLGDKGELPTELKELYSENGIAHILAISGLHIAVLGMGLYRMLRRFGGFRPAGLAAGGLITLYVLMTGSAVSACRAGLMFVIQLFSHICGRSYDMLSAAAAALLILLWQNPWYLYNSGCQLSFGAVLAIGGLLPCLIRLYRMESAPVRALLSSCSVSLITFPILTQSFFEISPYGVLLNLAVLPCMTLVMLSGVLGALAGLLHPLAGGFFAALGGNILLFYEWLCRLAQRLPGSRIITGRTEPYMALLYYAALALLLLFLSSVRKQMSGRLRIAVAALLLCLPGLLCIRRREGLYVCFLDVSQGDGIYMETAEGLRILVDGGSSDERRLYEKSLLPFLKSEGVSRLDYAVVTHPDEDHISGLRELIADGEIRLGCLLLPEVEAGYADEAWLGLCELARTAGISVGTLAGGSTLEAGALTLRCLYPYRGLQTEERNGWSTVLEVEYGEFSMLLTGDLDAAGEEYLVSEELSENRHYTVLKVAHHGSRFSTGESFLERVSAEYAVISCGEKNRYGHPHSEVLERLEAAGTEALTTAEYGALLWETDGKRVRAEGMRKGIIDIP